MRQPFSLVPLRCAVISDPSLREEIERHTQDPAATRRILSSIVRFGSDSTILRYEMIPLPYARTSRLGGSMAWTVRAVRNRPELGAEAARNP